jgi:hypothetical protein
VKQQHKTMHLKKKMVKNVNERKRRMCIKNHKRLQTKLTCKVDDTNQKEQEKV